MIIDTLDYSNKYESLNPLFKKGFDYLKALTRENFPEAKLEIEGEDLFALSFKGTGSGTENMKLEAHKKYIDIHYIFTGSDLMAYKTLSACKDVHTAFIEKDDYMLFKDEPASMTNLPAGYLAIVFPEDAHAPLVGKDDVWKVILKVKV